MPLSIHYNIILNVKGDTLMLGIEDSLLTTNDILPMQWNSNNNNNYNNNTATNDNNRLRNNSFGREQ
jgi:hypothetical protein